MTSRSRLAGIEGLRALAATCILVAHVNLYGGEPDLGRAGAWLAPHLWSGLTLFFALSGFLLYRPFAAAVLRDRPLPDVRGYLRNRALRILPAYWVVLLVTALVLGSATLALSAREFGYMTDPGLLLQNLLLVQHYTPGSIHTGVSPAWSLAVEVVFYLSLPPLGMLALRLARGRSRGGRLAAALAPAWLLLVVGLSGKAIAQLTGPANRDLGAWGQNWHSVLERSFPVSADLFAFGMAAAVVTVLVEDGWVRRTGPLRRRVGVAGLGLIALVGGAYTAHLIGTRVYDTLMALVCGLGILWLVLPRERPSRVVALLEQRPVVWLGVVSYSVYLWHEPVIHWLGRQDLLAAGAAGLARNVAVVVLLTLAASALTHRFVEAPAMRRKARRPESAPRTESPDNPVLEPAP